jgi:predicted PurR-regulated permease PerM
MHWGAAYEDTMQSKTRNVEPFYWLLGSAAFVVVIAGLRAAQSLVVPFLIAAFIAVICTPALQWLQRKGAPEWLAIIMVVCAVSAVALVVVAIATGSINEFVQQVPKYENNLAEKEAELTNWLKQKYSSVADEFGKQLNSAAVMGYIKSALIGLTSAFSNVFLVLLTVLFMLLEATGFPRKLLALSNGQPGSLQKAEKVRQAIVHYISLKTALSLLTGVLVGLLVMALRIDFPILWGMMAFLLNFIPNVGSILAAIPAVLLAVVQHDLSTALLAVAGYGVINVVIGNVVEPRVMGKGLGLSTLVVFVSLVFWGWVLGLVGMLLSVPLTMIVKIVMESFDETRWLAVLLGSNPEPQRGKS